MYIFKQLGIGIALVAGLLVVLSLVMVFLLLLRQAFPLQDQKLVPPSTKAQLPATTTNFLRSEELVVVIPPTTQDELVTSTPPVVLPLEPVLFEYVEVIDSCGPHFEGDCLNARSGPGAGFPSRGKLRNGVVLKVGGSVETDSGTWYKIVFDEWLRYPERLQGDWYVSADYVDILLDEGTRTIDGSATSTKRIIVDRGDQKLYAYDGDTLFMETTISTGIELTPTPLGTFTIFKKTPSRYMQGPLPYLAVSKYYDLPGVPWNLYFTSEGAVIHGAYWHNSFGTRYSSGCVNMRMDEAYTLYTFAELGTTVTVRD